MAFDFLKFTAFSQLPSAKICLETTILSLVIEIATEAWDNYSYLKYTTEQQASSYVTIIDWNISKLVYRHLAFSSCRQNPNVDCELSSDETATQNWNDSKHMHATSTIIQHESVCMSLIQIMINHNK